jgi:class 3 adenylate cyclase
VLQALFYPVFPEGRRLMHISGWLVSLTARAVAESMDVRTMRHLASKLLHNYDIHERTGFPRNIAIPNKTAAEQIVKDLRDSGLFLELVDLLIEIGNTGHMGRKYRVPHLREIVLEINKAGFVYDEEFKMFVEDSKVRRTKNWGVLREAEEYIFTFLRIDTVGNSDMVRKYPDELIQSAYSDLRAIVQKSVEKRNGRIWSWEGDGGTVAFYFSQKNNSAALSGIEIIHELFFYNAIRSRLDEPLKVRIAVHSGPCEFRFKCEDIRSEALKKIAEIESNYTKPGNVTFSSNVYYSLDPIIAEQLKPMDFEENPLFFRYELCWEENGKRVRNQS